MISLDLLTANDFIGVRAALITELGNDANRAVVLTRIFYRADERWREAHEGDGHWWWRATYGTLSAETGLSEQQVRRCVRWLIEEGHIEAAEFRRDGITDRTLSYRVITDLSESTDDVSESTDQGLSESTGLPSYQTEKKIKLVDGERTKAEIDHVFGLFWEAYPRHIAKAKARTAFEAALKKVRANVVLEGAKAYRRHVGDSDPKYIAHPTTWLNAERWDDDYGPVPGTGRDAIRRL